MESRSPCVSVCECIKKIDFFLFSHAAENSIFMKRSAFLLFANAQIRVYCHPDLSDVHIIKDCMQISIFKRMEILLCVLVRRNKQKCRIMIGIPPPHMESAARVRNQVGDVLQYRNEWMRIDTINAIYPSHSSLRYLGNMFGIRPCGNTHPEYCISEGI